MKKEPKTISEALREAILNSGETRYAIAHGAGVEQASLSRFIRGQTGLTTVSLDRLGLYLGLAVVSRKRRPKPKQEGM